MKRSLSSIVTAFTGCLLVCLLATVTVPGQQRIEPLTNTSVIKLVRAGFKEKTVIAIIHSRANRFDLSPDRLIELKHNGVTENVILAMLAQDGLALMGSDDLSDDAFFRRGENSPRADNDGNPKDEGTSIFGSGGSSNEQTRNRGARGSSEGDLQTNGTATVRILRPPLEDGGAPVKLEKTPTLNNEAVIELVEAGFSEGTIVKRIQKSPVEFDLSPAKLVELRKHRVTDPIIAAMSAAMKDETNPKTGTEKSREN